MSQPHTTNQQMAHNERHKNTYKLKNIHIYKCNGAINTVIRGGLDLGILEYSAYARTVI